MVLENNLVCETCGEIENITDMGEGEYLCNECSTCFDVVTSNGYVPVEFHEYTEDEKSVILEDLSSRAHLRNECYDFLKLQEESDTKDIIIMEVISNINIFLRFSVKEDGFGYLEKLTTRELKNLQECLNGDFTDLNFM